MHDLGFGDTGRPSSPSGPYAEGVACSVADDTRPRSERIINDAHPFMAIKDVLQYYIECY